MPEAVTPTNSTEITGFTTRDGASHYTPHSVAWVQGNEFVVASKEGGHASGVPASEVVSVDVPYTNGWAVAGIVLLSIVVALGVVVAIFFAAGYHSYSPPSGSWFCPFVYSWDGQRYVLDGEPNPAAIARALARTDSSALVHLASVDGEYRVLLTNEQDETQHTDSLALLAVDHFPSATVVLGQDGAVHALEHRQRLVSATDEHAADVLPLLIDVDQVSWLADLEEATTHGSPPDTRNHLTLTFRRPNTAGPVYLISNVATSHWGALQAHTVLNVLAAEERLSLGGAALRQYQDWNAREELFQLAVQVRLGSRWERRGLLVASGPYVSESRAMLLDLTGVEGDTVQLRLDPPVGFWRLNAFQLAWGESPTQVQLLKARVARDETGRDVRAQLASDDGWTLDQPQAPNVTQLTFPAPPVPAGLQRAVFARTHGWYEAHRHDVRPPDVAALQRLQTEPGYAVRRALEAYGEFRRTGVLPGFPPVANADAGGRPDTLALQAPRAAH